MTDHAERVGLGPVLAELTAPGGEFAVGPRDGRRRPHARPPARPAHAAGALPDDAGPGRPRVHRVRRRAPHLRRAPALGGRGSPRGWSTSRGCARATGWRSRCATCPSGRWRSGRRWSPASSPCRSTRGGPATSSPARSSTPGARVLVADPERVTALAGHADLPPIVRVRGEGPAPAGVVAWEDVVRPSDQAPPAVDDRAGRHRDAHLHVRHHGPAEGRRQQPPQPRDERAERRVPRPCRRAGRRAAGRCGGPARPARHAAGLPDVPHRRAQRPLRRRALRRDARPDAPLGPRRGAAPHRLRAADHRVRRARGAARRRRAGRRPPARDGLAHPHRDGRRADPPAPGAAGGHGAARDGRRRPTGTAPRRPRRRSAPTPAPTTPRTPTASAVRCPAPSCGSSTRPRTPRCPTAWWASCASAAPRSCAATGATPRPPRPCCATGGCPPVTSGCGATGGCSSSTARRTSSCAAGRTSTAARSRPRCSRSRACTRPPSSGSRTRVSARTWPPCSSPPPAARPTPARCRRPWAATLPSFAVPGTVIWRGEPLPRTATGKVLKDTLRGELAEPPQSP